MPKCERLSLVWYGGHWAKWLPGKVVSHIRFIRLMRRKSPILVSSTRAIWTYRHHQRMSQPTRHHINHRTHTLSPPPYEHHSRRPLKRMFSTASLGLTNGVHYTNKKWTQWITSLSTQTLSSTQHCSVPPPTSSFAMSFAIDYVLQQPPIDDETAQDAFQESCTPCRFECRMEGLSEFVPDGHTGHSHSYLQRRHTCEISHRPPWVEWSVSTTVNIIWNR